MKTVPAILGALFVGALAAFPLHAQTELTFFAGISSGTLSGESDSDFDYGYEVGWRSGPAFGIGVSREA